MKKTIREYLTECRDMACNNLFYYSSNYKMDTPRAGYEAQFAGAQRDIEIVDELIAMTEECPTSDDPDVALESICFDISEEMLEMLRKVAREEAEDVLAEPEPEEPTRSYTIALSPGCRCRWRRLNRASHPRWMGFRCRRCRWGRL